jgi:hypothetical protein
MHLQSWECVGSKNAIRHSACRISNKKKKKKKKLPSGETYKEPAKIRRTPVSFAGSNTNFSPKVLAGCNFFFFFFGTHEA